MRTMAGFREKRGSFYLPRAKIDPPESLQRQLWPEIDGWLAKYEEFNPRATDNAVERPDLAGAGFLRLLKYLRVVILQDSVVLRDLFPNHPIWKYYIFHTEQYVVFREQVLVALKDKENPADVQIKMALSFVADRMNMNTENIKATVLGESKKLNNSIQNLLQQVTDFASGRRGFTVYANPAPEKVLSSTPAVLTFSGGYTDIPQSQEVAQVPNLAPGSQYPPPFFPTHDTPFIPSALYFFSESLPQSRFKPNLLPVMYVMKRDVNTVTELWREWSVGLGNGPSIIQLNATWGSRWKAGNKGQFYSRRLPIIKAIKALVDKGKAFTQQEAAATLKTLRLQGNISLNKFGQNLAAGQVKGAVRDKSKQMGKRKA
jgi:hypothetical protein